MHPSRHIRGFRVGLAAALAALCVAPAFAAGIQEVEPNNTCSTAQALGTPAPSIQVIGAITANDVDFFEADAAPGTWVEVAVTGKDSAGNNFLVGQFDDQCGFLANVEETLMAKATPTGKVHFAVAGFGDFGYTGQPWETGSYSYTVGAPTHSYAVGTVLDASTGLPPESTLNTIVTAYACTGSDPSTCTKQIDGEYVSGYDGTYVVPLGSYANTNIMLKLSAVGFYGTVTTPVIALGATPSLVTQDFTLAPPVLPATIGNVTGCSVIVAGHDCRYSYTVTNTTSQTQTLNVWAEVSSSETGAAASKTDFDVGRLQRSPLSVTLAPGQTAQYSQLLQTAAVLPGVSGQLTLNAAPASDPTTLVGTNPGFAWRVSASGTSVRQATLTKPLDDAALARRRAAAARGVAAASAAGKVIGKVVDASGAGVSTPIELHVCFYADDRICSQAVMDGHTLPNGLYSLDVGSYGLPAGRYQVWTASSAIDQAHGRAFQYDGTSGVAGGSISTQPTSVTIDNVTNCSGQPAQLLGQYAYEAGTACTVGYTLTNHSSAPLTLDAWIMALADRSAVSPAGTSPFLEALQFSAGQSGGFVPVRVTLQPGETQTISQPVPLTALPVGAGGDLSIWVSAADAPLKPYAYWSFQLYAVTP